MIYLVVGVDRSTFARWHENVAARDVAGATRIARSRAAVAGVDLVVAGVIGPYSNVLTEATDVRAGARQATLRVAR